MRQRLKKTALAAAPAALLFAASLASAPLATALTLDDPAAAIGQWEIALSPGAATCRLTLRGEKVRGGFFVGMPPACRHSMPVLANVTAWDLPGDSGLGLADVYGKPVLEFKPGEAGHLAAAGPRGETYRLAFVEGLPAPRGNPSAASQDAPAAASVAPPHPILRPGDVAGRYAVLRDAGRDTGCMVTLDEGGGRAFLAPACRDQGIVIFDPSAWRLAAGRLVLTARKGHKAEFDLQPDGAWLKDAKDGRSLSLKKL
jgi:hypothetical protein